MGQSPRFELFWWLLAHGSRQFPRNEAEKLLEFQVQPAVVGTTLGWALQGTDTEFRSLPLLWAPICI